MYTINTSTAAMTLAAALGNGNDGEAIAFNPEDGLMYHWSGWGAGNVIMETIDLGTFATTPVTLSGSVPDNVGSAVYAGNGTFIASDVNNNGVIKISSTGVTSATANTTSELKGLAFWQPLPSDVYGVDPFSADFSIIDTANYTNTTITLTSSLGTVTGANGLSSDYCGTIYIVYKHTGAPGRHLGTVDPSTGVVTDIGTFTDNIATIAFDNNGVLYGVTGDGATVSETMYIIDISTAAMTLAATLGNGNDGEAIAFNPEDGLMYHWSGWGAGNVIMETIDLGTFTTTPVTLSGSIPNNVGSAVYAGNGTFIASDVNSQEIIEITSAGVASATPNTTLALKGLSFSQGFNPSITSSVANDTICPGETAILTCAFAGATYDWYQDGISTGVTTSTFNATTAGVYYCEVTAGCTKNSNSIEIVVGSLPSVNLTPNPSAEICPGDSVEISVNFGGGALVQWYMDGVAIPGANGGSVFASAAGTYNCTKTNAFGCTDSSAVGTTITLGTPPTVVLTPTTAEICPGDSVEILSNGTAGSTFQWFMDGTTIPGATNDSYFASAAGSYNCIETPSAGCPDSAAVGAAITIANVPTTILTPSPTANYCTGDSVEISVNAGGGGGTFQWYMDGAMIPGATNTSYFASMDGVYNCVKTNTAGCSDSAAVGTVAIDTCLATIPELDDMSFVVYPNPAQNAVSIQLENINSLDIVSIELVAIDGKVIARIDAMEENEINVGMDVSTFDSGVYLIRVNTSFGRLIEELIIE